MIGSVTFDAFFQQIVGFPPYDWQRKLAQQGLPEILPVPTGFGKTEGAVLAWAWRRLVQKDKAEPLHLVYCLPMRTLVRQTVQRLQTYCANLRAANYADVCVYQLQSGVIDEEWAGKPDHPWLLVGTQDQLLSRALNRGYSMNRYDWPVHFGLLNQDCRWIIDEVQLMGPGLWTTAQLDWMRRKRFHSLKPCLTTWMSATMAASFLATTDRKKDGCDTALSADLPFDDPALIPRRKARRPIAWAQEKDPQEIADLVGNKHQRGTLSLVVCNTVETARKIFETLPATSPKILLTARFRRQDRESNEGRLLAFEEKRRKHVGPIPNDPGLICVSTQVVEAGLDISAHRLWSELAPWSSVIQRLGRLNRDGRDQDAQAWFWETSTPRARGEKNQDRIGPYQATDLAVAKKLLNGLIPISHHPFADALETLKQCAGSDLQKALQPEPESMPRALDLHGLFSTERDVHGGFTDVSAFVRSTDPDADVTVFWRHWSSKNNSPPTGDDLDGPPLNLDQEACPVPAFRLQEFLTAQKANAWVWDEERERWEKLGRDELRPGMVVMLHRGVGGYDPGLGWTGDSRHQLDPVPRAGKGRMLRDEARTEVGCWVPLDVHLADAKGHAEDICKNLQLEGLYRTAVVEAAALHDIGKALPQWQEALPVAADVLSGPWAKCPWVLAIDVAQPNDAIRAAVSALRPDAAELAPVQVKRGRETLYRLRWAVSTKLTTQERETLSGVPGIRWAGHPAFRPGLRHEAASALAMWSRYRQGSASYPALAVYLTAAHHGKVRTVLRSIAESGDDVFGIKRESYPIQVNGSTWPLDFSVAHDGAKGQWSDDGFILTAPGWTGLVSDLLGPWQAPCPSPCLHIPPSEPHGLGPFVLAYLEALVRAADWRASANPSQSVKPQEIVREHQPA